MYWQPRVRSTGGDWPASRLASRIEKPDAAHVGTDNDCPRSASGPDTVPSPSSHSGAPRIAKEKGSALQVIVRDNNVEQAIRVLKKKLQREGVFKQMKAHATYEKPSERRNRQKAQAIKRHRKYVRKQMKRDGLIPGAGR
jgi:small subunit ribosomal protein S21